MSNFEEEVFVEYASVLSSTIDDEKKLELSDDDITELRVYVNKLDEYQQQCQVALVRILNNPPQKQIYKFCPTGGWQWTKAVVE